MYWRLQDQRYSLQGTKCSNCNSFSFPPRIVCPYCEGINAQSREGVTIIQPKKVVEGSKEAAGTIISGERAR